MTESEMLTLAQEIEAKATAIKWLKYCDDPDSEGCVLARQYLILRDQTKRLRAGLQEIIDQHDGARTTWHDCAEIAQTILNGTWTEQELAK